MCHLKRIAVLGSLASAFTLCSGLKPQALAITRIRRFCVICLYAPRHPNLLRSLSAVLHKVVMMMWDRHNMVVMWTRWSTRWAGFTSCTWW